MHTTGLGAAAAAAASLLGLSDGAEGGVETFTRAVLSLKLQYSDCHWGGLWPAANWLQTASDSVAPPRAWMIIYWTRCSITHESITHEI